MSNIQVGVWLDSYAFMVTVGGMARKSRIKELGRDLSALSQSANRLCRRMQTCEPLQMTRKQVEMRFAHPVVGSAKQIA
ncbi:MAG: hypothetical protein R8J85_01890 [Mariprofundales bacterium]